MTGPARVITLVQRSCDTKTEDAVPEPHQHPYSQSLQGFFNVDLLWIECMFAVLTGIGNVRLDRSMKRDKKLMD